MKDDHASEAAKYLLVAGEKLRQHDMFTTAADNVLALSMFERSGQLGNPEALAAAADMYDSGVYGVESDRLKAEQLFEQALLVLDAMEDKGAVLLYRSAAWTYRLDALKQHNADAAASQVSALDAERHLDLKISELNSLSDSYMDLSQTLQVRMYELEGYAEHIKDLDPSLHEIGSTFSSVAPTALHMETKELELSASGIKQMATADVGELKGLEAKYSELALELGGYLDEKPELKSIVELNHSGLHKDISMLQYQREAKLAAGNYAEANQADGLGSIDSFFSSRGFNVAASAQDMQAGAQVQTQSAPKLG